MKNFGFCKLAVVPVRAAASDASEIVTQLLFGDLVEVIEKGEPWIKVRLSAEEYEGWMDFKQLTYVDHATYSKLISEKPIYTKDLLTTVIGPLGEQSLMLGSAFRNIKGDQMRLGDSTYQLKEWPSASNRTLVETAKLYSNTPYLWGGKSIFGIDCSGFVQNCFKVYGKELPRDALQQVHEGELIDYTERQIGDVPFFINAKGKIHHVGILIGLNEIIHAAGHVRSDSFDEKGIFRTDFDRYTHHFHSIRRFL